MMVFERVKFLAKKHSKTMKQITNDLGYSENYFYSLNSGKHPTAERINEIADYFNVSTDYLLGRTDNPEVKDGDTTNDLDEMLDNVMSFDGKPMTDHDREVIRAFLKGKFDKN